MDETKVQIGDNVLLDIGIHSDWYISVICYNNESVNVELRRKTDRNNKWWVAEQTENNSEKPNNCETCEHYKLTCDLFSEICKYELKNNSTISKMEQVDEPTEITYQNCSDALLKMWMDNVLTDAEFNRIIDKLNNAQHDDEPQYDTDKGTIKCDNCSENGSYKCSKCDGEMYFKRLAVKDELQTCDTCKYGEDKHKYAHICNECGVGINNYEPKDGRK